MKKTKLIYPIAFVLFCCTLHVHGQESWIDTSRHKGLVELKTEFPFKVFVSNDSLKTTPETIEYLNNAKLYFDRVFGTDLEFAVLFVGNQDWNKHAYFPPPGLPQALNGNIILGLDKSIVSKEVENNIKRLPNHFWTTLKSVYGGELDLDLFYRDILSIHELAHLYHFQGGIRPQRKWLQELFATMGMYSFVKEQEESFYALMDTYPKFVLQSGNEMAEYRALKDFEEKYVQKLTPQNYEWFQMQFYKHAKSIMDSNGESILVKLRNFLIQTDLGKTDILTDPELMTRLKNEVGKEIAAIMADWDRP